MEPKSLSRRQILDLLRYLDEAHAFAMRISFCEMPSADTVGRLRAYIELTREGLQRLVVVDELEVVP